MKLQSQDPKTFPENENIPEEKLIARQWGGDDEEIINQEEDEDGYYGGDFGERYD